jgi:GNAT superfamily N-acetyltransferase
MNLIIRNANFDDLSHIYSLVKELAVYEESGDQVTVNLKDYKKDFNENLFESLVAINNGEIIGMMLYYMTYSTWKGKMVYLEDFIVREEHRNKGVGQQLFNTFIKVAKDKKAKLVKWQVLDWNTPAINFYKKNDAVIEKNWWTVKILLDT